MKELLNKYNEFLTNPRPGLIWKIFRFILHWITLPLKLALFIIVYIVMQVYMSVKYKKRELSELPDRFTRLKYFKHILKNLPVYKNERINLHVLRVPMLEPISGNNHNA